MTKIRLASGLILLAIAIIFIQVGGWFFFSGVTLISLIATWEFVRMMKVKGHAPNLIFAMGFVLIPLVFFQLPALDLFVPAITLLFVLSLIGQLFQADSKAPVVDWALTIVGPLYIGLGMGHLLGLRLLDGNGAWTWLALLATAGADTSAYFAGRTFGKHKFWPRLSPKKTWEGFIGGLFGGMLGGWLVSFFFTIPLAQALIVGLVVAIFTPLGDLSISMMKRYAGVKDSSQLIPGHGGFLDRIDSVLFAVIIVFYCVSWAGLGIM